MQWHELIFSEDRKIKTARHVVFWMVWWLYFLLCFFLMQQPVPKTTMQPGHLIIGQHIPLKTSMLIILYGVACYAMLCLVFPNLLKRQWLKAITDTVLALSFLLISSHYLYWNLFPLFDTAPGYYKPALNVAWFWPAINLGLINFIKVAAAATVIKCIKYWWLKQKEIQRLEKDKLSAELQLLKAQVHPDFLLSTLNNIYNHALSSSPRTSNMLLKLSDLLSYMLYECDTAAVPIEKEIAMMKEYMQLEKIRYNDVPELQISIKGNVDSKCIAPFLLFPFIENSFKHCDSITEQPWINMDIRVNGDHFSLKLTNGVSDKIADPTINAVGLTTVQKRLAILYPGKHELRITMEQEMSIVLLDIQLDALSGTPFNSEETNLPTAYERSLTPAL